MKLCKRCVPPTLKPLTEFYKRKQSKDGHHSWCKDCCLTYTQQFFAKHPEALAKKQEQTQAWVKANPRDRSEYHKQRRAAFTPEQQERERQQSRNRRAEKPEQYRETQKRWVAANPEKVQAKSKKYHTLHREQINTRARQNRLEHPERDKAVKLRFRAKHHARLLLIERERHKLHRDEERQQSRRWWINLSPEQLRQRRHRKRELYALNPEYAHRMQRLARQWRQKYPHRVKTLMRAWRLANPGRSHELQARRRARLKNAPIIERFTIEEIAERDGWHCHLCLKKVTRKTWSIDHLIPLSHGGPHTKLYVALAHQRCNSRRGAGRIPAQLRLLP
jgi:hypothetical protein